MEFRDIDKRLHWTLLKLRPSHVSVFDTKLDDGGPAPGYMRHLCAGTTWEPARRLRAALLEAAVTQERADAVLIEGTLKR